MILIQQKKFKIQLSLLIIKNKIRVNNTNLIQK